MKTRVFYGNQYIGSIRVDGRKYTKWQVFKMKSVRRIKRTLTVLAIFFLGVWVWYGIVGIMPESVQAIGVPVYITSTSTAPVMKRIAKCESGGAHYGKDGQVIIHVNSNGSYDIGKYQINSVHNLSAKKMGLDLTKEADNEKYAMYLYENEGTGDWYSSRSCWQ